MMLQKAGINAGKEIVAWVKAGNKSSLVLKPIQVNIQTLKLSAPLSKDAVDISKLTETCTQQIYHKVQCWTPIDKHLGFPGIYQIPEDYIGTGHIYIDKIVADKAQSAGTGTRTIQKILRESLADSKCQGRLRLQVFPLDISRGNPLGFYYKLGFRADNIELNKKCAQWLANGGQKDKVPFSMGANMYLPKENIEHCLNYPS